MYCTPYRSPYTDVLKFGMHSHHLQVHQYLKAQSNQNDDDGDGNDDDDDESLKLASPRAAMGSKC